MVNKLPSLEKCFTLLIVLTSSILSLFLWTTPSSFVFFNTMQFFVTHFILRTYRLPYLPMLSLSVSCFPCICFLEQKETLCVGRLTACVSAQCSELHVIAALKPFNGDCQHKVRPCLPAETRQGLLQRRKEATI